MAGANKVIEISETTFSNSSLSSFSEEIKQLIKDDPYLTGKYLADKYNVSELTVNRFIRKAALDFGKLDEETGTLYLPRECYNCGRVYIPGDGNGRKNCLECCLKTFARDNRRVSDDATRDLFEKILKTNFEEKTCYFEGCEVIFKPICEKSIYCSAEHTVECSGCGKQQPIKSFSKEETCINCSKILEKKVSSSSIKSSKDICQNCGKSIPAGRTGVTCSGICSQALRAKDLEERVCLFENCGKTFKPSNQNSKYCSVTHEVTCNKCGSKFETISKNLEKDVTPVSLIKG